MTLQTLYDNAMLRGPQSVPVIARLGGGTLATVGDSHPFRVVGQQAVVYQLRQPSGKVLALRAWLSDEIDPDLARRYRALAEADFLRHSRSIDHTPLVHALSYHADAVMIEADDPRLMSRPMIVMDWLMGPTVLAAVDRACRARDGAYLNALAGAWRNAVAASAEIGFVHGDLTADNAIVRPKEGVAFVDYDTAYWPGSPSVPALQPAAAYRHPNGPSPAPERADDFAALLIYTSLRVLAIWPELRIEHGQPATVRGAGLLFQHRDLTNPDGSALFGKARVISDTAVLGLVGVLREIAMAPVTDVPRFNEALDLADSIARSSPTAPVRSPSRHRKPSIVADVAHVERERTARAEPVAVTPIDQTTAEQAWPQHQRAWNPDALSILAKAIASGDVNRAEAAWNATRDEPGAHALLPALHVLRARHQEARDGQRTRRESRDDERKASIRRDLANALDRHDGEALADLALSGDLDELDDLTIASTRQVVAALAVQHLDRAIASDDDTLILEAYDETIMATTGVLTSAQRDRVDLAFERRAWLADIRDALRTRHRERVDRLYDVMPGLADERLTEREKVRIERLREQDDAVRALERAMKQKDDAEVVAALQRVERVGAWLPESLVWSEVSNVVDRHTLTAAIHRAATQTPRDHARLARLLPQLRDVCGGKLPVRDSVVDFAQLDLEVKQVAQATRLREALMTDDDRRIVTTAFPDLYGIIPRLERGEQARIERAVAVVNRALRRSGQRTPMTSASSSTVETT